MSIHLKHMPENNPFDPANRGGQTQEPTGPTAEQQEAAADRERLTHPAIIEENQEEPNEPSEEQIAEREKEEQGERRAEAP